MRWPDMKRLRPLGQGLLWSFGLVLAVILINLLAIRLLGDVHAWSTWLRDHTLGLLLWRLGLYAALIYGWWRMRARLLRREPQSRQRLRRAEAAGIAALVLLELSNALSGSEAP